MTVLMNLVTTFSLYLESGTTSRTRPTFPLLGISISLLWRRTWSGFVYVFPRRSCPKTPGRCDSGPLGDPSHGLRAPRPRSVLGDCVLRREYTTLFHTHWS